MDPKGEFYLHQLLRDDFADNVERGKALDAIWVVLQTTEAIAVGLSVVKAVGWPIDATKLRGVNGEVKVGQRIAAALFADDARLIIFIGAIIIPVLRGVSCLKFITNTTRRPRRRIAGGAAHVAAGPDGVRGSGPYQECALKKRVELSGSSRMMALSGSISTAA